MPGRRSRDTTKRPTSHRPPTSPRELYHHEKRRRAGKPPDRDLMAEAEQAFREMLAAEAEAGRGGRPKKSKAKPEEQVDDE
jgi:hypothetical protein